MRRYLADGLNMGPHFRGWSTLERNALVAALSAEGTTSASPVQPPAPPATSLASAAAADLAASDPSLEPPTDHDAPRSRMRHPVGGPRRRTDECAELS